MKKFSAFSLKAILLLALFAISSNSFAQMQKPAYKMKYTTGTGKSVEGDLVVITFYVLNIADNGDGESLATLMRAQDGVKKVKMSPITDGNAVCSLAVGKNFSAELVQKMLVKVGFDEAIIDGVAVPMDKLHDYMGSRKKQKEAK